MKKTSFWKKLILLKLLGAMGGGGIEKTKSGNPIHITDALAKPVQALSIALEPIQSGSGDPSPDNIRPISGHTDADVTRTGVNVWDEEWEVNGTYIRSKNYISVRPSTTYYWKASAMPANGATFYDINKNVIQNVYSFSQNLINTPSNCYYMKFSMGSAYGTTYNNDISINYPSTDHDYHAYVGTTYPIPLGTTVYGGTLDVVTGELTVTKAIVDLSTLYWAKYDTAQGTLFRSGAVADAANVFNSTNFICSNYATVQSLSRSNGTISCAIAKAFDIIDNAYTDAATFKTAMSGVQLVYELATPQTIQLTPQQVELLLGENNLWSEGEMTLVYLADGNASDVEALNILLGNRYVNNHEADEPTDREALNILLGGNER